MKRCPADLDGKLVLASGIAESSVTIDGVRLVIGSGLSRQLRFDPNTGMEGLETVPASLARRINGGAGPDDKALAAASGCSSAEQQRRPVQSTELLLADPNRW